jgi:tetratricopeptide (TPR) repeat protein
VLAYFRASADARQLADLSAGEGVPPPIRGVPAERWAEVLVEAQQAGLVNREGVTSRFTLHPLLPWYLRRTLQGVESAALAAAARRHFARLAANLEGALRGEASAAAAPLFAANKESLLNALALARRARDVTEVAALYSCLNTFMDFARQRGQLAALRAALVDEWRPSPPLDSRSEQGRFWLTLEFHRAIAHLDAHDLGKAEEVYRHFLAAAPGVEAIESAAYHGLGLVAQERHDLEGAEGWHRKALEVLLRLHDERGAADTCGRLGNLAERRHDLEGAEGWYRKALEAFLRLHDERGAAPTYYQLGWVAQRRHDLEGAEGWHRKALEAFLRLHDELSAAKAQQNLGNVAQKRHDLEGAEGWYQKALEVFLRLHYEPGAARTYEGMGLLAVSQRNAVCASHLLQAFRRFTACKDSHRAEGALAHLRQFHQEGIVPRQAVEQAWQAETGEPLPANVAAKLFLAPVEPGDGTPSGGAANQ